MSESLRDLLDFAVETAYLAGRLTLRVLRRAIVVGRGRPNGLGVLLLLALVAGEGARSRSLAVEGELLEIRGQEAVLESGGMRFTLTVADLEPTGRALRGKGPDPAPPLPEITPATEIDMRGLRVEEVEERGQCLIRDRESGEKVTPFPVQPQGRSASD